MPRFKFLVKFLVTMTVTTAAIIACFLYFTSIGQEFVIKGKQYTTQNIDKNWGVRKNILLGMDEILALLLKSNYVKFNKLESQAGANLEHSSVSDWREQAKRVVKVLDSESLLKALRSAQAGDFIFISPGKYEISQRTIYLGAPGERDSPISVIASRLEAVELQLNSFEGIYLDKPFWRFKNVIFKGSCSKDSSCEHAFHLVGDADHALLENNKFINFNSAIKSNGNYKVQPYAFPDNVIVRNNDFFNETIRQTRSPASPIDVVGGNDWLVDGNFIADFSRQVKTKHSVVYGAFFKGAGENVTFQNNVINCEWQLPHQSALDIRVGFSLGNGGTADKYCQNARCNYEHKGGKILNNLILNCQNDVSIYLNKAQNTALSGNVLLNSLGVDARYPNSTGIIENNTVEGRIKNRQGATMQIRDNQIH